MLLSVVLSYLIMPIICGIKIIMLPVTYQHSVKTHSFASLYVPDTIFKEQLNHPKVKNISKYDGKVVDVIQVKP